MTQVRFYHLLKTPLEKALPKLLEKVLETGQRAVVRAASKERAEFLNAALWTYEAGSFLPHGSARDGHGADQPVWITQEEENPNNAGVVILTDGMVCQNPGDYAKCLEVFDGNDQAAVSAARERWKTYGEAGFERAYYQQTDRGGWEEKG